MRKPNFENLLKVLAGEKTNRPVLFEFTIHDGLLQQLAGSDWRRENSRAAAIRNWIHGFWHAGYDFSTVPIWECELMTFSRGERQRQASVSLNEGAVIADRAGFEAYPWPNPDAHDYDKFNAIAHDVPTGMKLVIHGPGGPLENLIDLVGYENLCYMLVDDRPLVNDICAAIGSRLLRYYERCVAYDCIGGAIVNDDWGFKTQSRIAPDDLREFIFPWHRKIVAAIHASNKPAILHSCGQLEAVWDDLIDDLKYDGKHSYEDAILPVEDAYERYGSRVAILGGIDMDFLARNTPDTVYRRAKELIERTRERGRYALGSGNSIPEYVPAENYLAMTRAAME